MRLSDILGNMDLSIYPIIAMIIFAGVFIIAMARVASASRSRVAGQAVLPLHDPNDALIGGATDRTNADDAQHETTRSAEEAAS